MASNAVNVTDMFDALAKLMSDMRDAGVRDFKGELPSGDGAKWVINVQFERVVEPRGDDE